MRYKLGFIGAGKMAEAIAKAAISEHVLTAAQLIASDPVEDRRRIFSDLGVRVSTDNGQVIRESDQLLLAVKPQTLASLTELRTISSSQIVLSIMAGVDSDKIVQVIGRSTRIVRIMPNTPLKIGSGMSALAMGKHAEAGDESLAVKLFGAAGKAIVVDESDMDAITAVSGSGPAYVFYLAEAMQKAAAELGLAEHAEILVRQTILGAAQLMASASESPPELRGEVTSPGGTTEAAIRSLDAHAVLENFVGAIKAAQARSVELGR